ncbi:MAG: FG-GAP-like repeat-containing protein [Pseudomarimonas sp.]
MIYDANGNLSLGWFTYGPDRRPIWLVGENGPVTTVIDNVNGVPTSFRVWQGNLHRYTWNYGSNGALGARSATPERVGSVAIRFHPNDATRAAIRWQWDVIGQDPASDECLRDFSQTGLNRPDPGPNAVNVAFNGAWFERAAQGWGIALNVYFDHVDGALKYLETTALTVFDDAGNPVWLMGELTRRAEPAPVNVPDVHALTMRFAGPGYQNGVPNTDCDRDDPCVELITEAGTWTRNYESTQVGRAGLELNLTQPRLRARFGSGYSGAAVTRFDRPVGVVGNSDRDGDGDLDPSAALSELGNYGVTIEKLSAVNQIAVNKTLCVVATPGANCAIGINWAASIDYPQATVYRHTLVPAGHWPVALNGGQHGEFTDALPAGREVQYKLHNADSADAPVLAVTPIVRISANQLPNVELTSPSPGNNSFAAPASITLTANANDADGTIKRIEFLNGGTVLYGQAFSSQSVSNVSFQWNNVAAGSYSISVRVTDNLDAPRVTTPITLVVSAPEVVPPAPTSPDATSDAVGGTVGEFRVDESGAATYKVPFFAAPGTAGVTPQVALSYSSHVGQGPQGRGWSISGTSGISRCRGTQEAGDGVNAPPVNFTTTDKFCLDGQRLLAYVAPAAEACKTLSGASANQFRTEIETFQRVCAYTYAVNDGPRFFTVESKDGSTRWYGDRRATAGGATGDYTDGVLEGNAEGQAGKVLLWAQTRVQDSVGNFVDHEYRKNPSGTGKLGEHLISKIHYTGKVANGSVVAMPYASINFVYEAYSAEFGESMGYLAGSQLWRTQRLAMVTSVSDGTTLRAYKLAYTVSPSGGGAMLLDQITECRDETAGATCLKPTVFNYGNGFHDFSNTHENLPGLTVGGLVHFKSLKFGDVDGDGRPDMVWIKGNSTACPHGEVRVAYGRLNAAGVPHFVEATGIKCVPTELLPDDMSSEDDVITKGADASWMLLDYTGDGKEDLLMRGSTAWVGYASVGSGGHWGSENLLASLSSSVLSGSQVKHQPQLADLNGDGLLDIVYFKTEGQLLYARLMERQGPENHYRWGSENVVTIPAGPNSDLCRGEANCSWRFEGLFRKQNYQQLNDFNGDGRSDILARVRVTRTLPTCKGGGGGGPGPGPGDPPIDPQRPDQSTSVCNFDAVYPLTVQSIDAGVVALAQSNQGMWAWNPSTFSRLSFADINGDGLTDLINHSSGTPNGFVSLNTGRGFGTGSVISSGALPLRQLQVLDINGDGRADVVYPNSNSTAFVSRRGKGVMSLEVNPSAPFGQYNSVFAGEAPFTGGQPLTECEGSIAFIAVRQCLGQRSYLFGDYDGDGVLEYIRINWGAGQQATVKTTVGRSSARNRPRDTLQTITNGLGAITQIKYLPQTNTEVHRRDLGSRNALLIGRGSPVSDLAAPLYLVSQASSSAPTFENPAALSSVYYRYVGGKLQAGGRGFLGFREIHTIDANHPGKHVVTVTGYRDDFPFIGMPHATIRFVNEGSFAPNASCTGPIRNDGCFLSAGTEFPPYTGVRVSWSSSDWENGATLGATPIPQRPRLKFTIDESHDLVSGNKLSTMVTDFGYDSWLNVTSTKVTTIDPGNAVVNAGEISTVNLYSNNATKWHLGRLTDSTVTYKRHGWPDIDRTTRFAYNPTTGLMEMQQIQPGGAINEDLRTFYVHDAYGNRLRTHTCSSDLSVTDCQSTAITFQSPGDRVQRYAELALDSRGRFAATTYEPFWNGSAATRVPVATITSRDAFGNVTAASDLNGARSSALYGVLGRPYYTWTQSKPGVAAGDPLGGVQRWTTYRWCAGAGDTPQVACPTGARYREEVRTTGAPSQWTYFDVLGRPLMAVSETFNAGVVGKDFSAVCTFSDARGRSARVSEAFFLPLAASGSEPQPAGTSCTAGSLHWTRSEFDALDRPTKVFAPDLGVSEFVYAQRKTTYTDPLHTEQVPRKRVEERNVFGEISEVTDAGGLVVHYEYDATGNQRFVRRNARVSASEGIFNENFYDRLGRRTQSLDPDAGTWDYTYNAAGELRTQRGSTSQQIEQLYDARGRVFEKRVNSSPSVREATHVYVFDTAAFGRGKLHSESVSGTYAGWTGQSGVANAFSRTYSYDALGRASAETTQIDGVNYSSGREYDRLGRAFRSFDASGQWTRSDFTARGHVKAMCDSPDSTAACVGNADTHVETLETDARGNAVRERRGGSAAMEVSRTYDPRTGRVTALRAGSGNAIQNDTYEWNLVGNLTARDKAGQYRETFLYDALNRLQVGYFERVLTTTYSGASRPYSEQISYDKLGNICAKQIAGALQTYTYAGRAGCGQNGVPGDAQGLSDGLPHAVQSAAGGAYTYDGHGNETSATFAANPGNHRYTRYTVENQAYEIARGSQSSPTQRARFWYGSDGARYKREDIQSGSVKRTLFLGNVEIITHAGVTTQKRYIAGVVVQDVINGAKTTKHLFHDHLGSVVRVTNASGGLLEGMDFGAFGERRGYVNPTSAWIPPASPTTTRGYTGHEMVDGLDVVHMNGRIYDSRLGRFMQPDPVVYVFVPASWNAYAYVYNNPLANVDPSGYEPVLGTTLVIASAWSASSIAIAGAVTAGSLAAFNAAAANSTTATTGVQGAYSSQPAQSPTQLPTTEVYARPMPELPSDGIAWIGGLILSSNGGWAGKFLKTDGETALYIEIINGQPASMASKAEQLNRFQTALDVAGLLPVIGIGADLINAGIHVARGNYLSAGITVVAAIPLVGDAIGVLKVAKAAGGAAKTPPGKFTVGAYEDIRGTVPGLDAHHVGQKAVMGELVPGYNPATAPAILIPKVGHTIKGPNGILSRSTQGFTSGRDVIARDIRELRRVYPEVPNSQLQQLIRMNKDMYPILNK